MATSLHLVILRKLFCLFLFAFICVIECGIFYFISASGNNESSSAGNLYDDLPSSEKIEDKKRKLEATEEDACTPAKRPLKREHFVTRTETVLL